MKVKEVMTKDPVKISPKASISEARFMFDKFRIWSIPVVDNQKVVGIITKKDIINRAKNIKNTVESIMSPLPITISPDEEIEIAAEIIHRKRVNALIVTENSFLVGIITKYDLRKSRVKRKFIRCQYCDTLYNESDNKCPYCGAFKK